MRWIVVVWLAGCYAPAAPEGAPCGPGRTCPSGQLCSVQDDRCYTDPVAGTDARAPDAPPATTCTPRRLLTGGTDVTAQGWTIERIGAGTITYEPGTTTLTTTNDARQLIVLRGAFPPDRFQLQLVGELVTSGGCTANNAAAAVMASFHDPSGTAADYAHMLCFANDSIHWGDGNGMVGLTFTQTGVVRLEPASGGIKATVIANNGMVSMTSGPFTSNGAIAIGDQSTAMGLDSTLRITAIDLMCP